MNVGGELHKANGGRAHRMTALIGGGWHSSSRRSSARSSWCRCRSDRRAKVFGPHAHDGAIALNLNLAEAGLMQSLNQHGNQ